MRSLKNVGLLLGVFLLGCVVTVKVLPKPVQDPPLPVYTPQDSVVKVVDRLPDVARCGYGVAVEYQGERFVMTSRLIFYSGVGEVTVNTLPATVMAEDEETGLVALKCDGVPAHYTLLTDAPAGPSVQVIADKITTVAQGQTVRKWVNLVGVTRVTGAPVFSGDHLVGLVIGDSNRSNEKVLAVTKPALLRLAKQVEGLK